MQNLKFEVGDDGIALLLIGVPGARVNTLCAAVLRDLSKAVDRIRSDPAIKGVVIASGKTGAFCAGADLGEMNTATAALDDIAVREAALAEVSRAHATFRALETCGKPVVAAINGVALGGGLELALACHLRIAADDGAVRVGLPEATLGLIPGGGGTQRLPRLLGAERSLPLLLEGRQIGRADALALGILDRVVAPADLVAEARAAASACEEPTQVWDRKGYRVPGGLPHACAEVFVLANALCRKSTFANQPAQLNILKCVYEGLQIPFETGLGVEARYFVETLRTPQARAMTRSLFLSMQALGKGAARPAGIPPFEIRKATVLGAGMMGAGIAYVQAMAGIETILIDTTLEAAERGKDYSRKLLVKAVSRGTMTAAAAEGVLARIKPATNHELAAGSQIVIEAVFEDRAIKAEVTARTEAWIGDAAVFGSNTSTLPITGLAETSMRPANFIGTHFFSPVDRMGLVEIIVGEKTSQETLAKTIDYVRKIRKTPIIVGDSRGFYTSRVFGTYLAEGFELLMDGVPAAVIDNVGRATGMPRGPLELSDDVSLELMHKVRLQTKQDLGDSWTAGRGDELLRRMVEDHGRLGRKNGKGFYDYAPDGTGKRLWSELAAAGPFDGVEGDMSQAEEVRKRLLYRQAIETLRCFEEGVLTDPRDADVGAILGWGFAPWTGGPISLIEGVGLAHFLETCIRFEGTYGERFQPPALLRDMVSRGSTFYGQAAVEAA